MWRISAFVSGSCYAQIQSIPSRIFQLRSIKEKSAWDRGYVYMWLWLINKYLARDYIPSVQQNQCSSDLTPPLPTYTRETTFLPLEFLNHFTVSENIPNTSRGCHKVFEAWGYLVDIFWDSNDLFLA